MIKLNFIFWNFIILTTYLYWEIVLGFVWHNIFKIIKFYNIQQTKKRHYIIFKNSNIILINLLIAIYIITIKSYNVNNFWYFTLINVVITLYLNKFLKSNLLFINFNLLIFLIFFNFINSFIIFLLYLELYSIIYYFFFLNIKNNNNIFLIKYKNNLLFYLWSNFFTTILYLIGLFYVIYENGTTNFYELNILNNFKNYFYNYFILLSFIFKINLPGIHFLKIEIYKYLSLDIVINFSILNIIFSYIFIIFIFSQNYVYMLLLNTKIFNFFLIFLNFIFINKIKINNFQEFIAFSGFATTNLILLNFLI